MTSISIIKCDGPDCKEQIDLSGDDYLPPTYTRLHLGGSDFEMSLGGEYLDFCCLDCLVSWIKGLNKYRMFRD